MLTQGGNLNSIETMKQQILTREVASKCSEFPGFPPEVRFAFSGYLVSTMFDEFAENGTDFKNIWNIYVCSYILLCLLT